MNKEELRTSIQEMQLHIPYTEDLTALSRPLTLRNGTILQNRLANHPMEGCDGNADGSPGELTWRRYRRFAGSGVGLLWTEAVSVTEDGRANPRQLWIHKENVDAFSRLVEELHRLCDAPVVIQLTHSGRFSRPHGTPAPVIAVHNPILNQTSPIAPDYPVVSDDYLDRLEEQFMEAAILAKRAGFDGIDIKCCHRYLFSELLSAYTREGRYGGSYENRTRLFFRVVSRVREAFGDSVILASRLGLYDAIPYPHGFGWNQDNTLQPDSEEALRVLGDLRDRGMALIDVTMGTPYHNPHVNRPYRSGGYTPPEHPLKGVERLIEGAALYQRTFPDMAFVGTGYSYLGAAAPYAAAGAIEAGMASMVGFGRMSFAYDTFARDMLRGALDSRKLCMACGKCTEIMRAGGTTGCPIRDKEVYMPIYRRYCLKEKE